MTCMTIDPTDWPNPPLQILDAPMSALPSHPDSFYSDNHPAWARKCVLAALTGRVPVVMFEEVRWRTDLFVWAFAADGVAYMWRDDGDRVWSLVSVFDEDRE